MGKDLIILLCSQYLMTNFILKNWRHSVSEEMYNIFYKCENLMEAKSTLNNTFSSIKKGTINEDFLAIAGRSYRLTKE